MTNSCAMNCLVSVIARVEWRIYPLSITASSLISTRITFQIWKRFLTSQELLDSRYIWLLLCRMVQVGWSRKETWKKFSKLWMHSEGRYMTSRLANSKLETKDIENPVIDVVIPQGGGRDKCWYSFTRSKVETKS